MKYNKAFVYSARSYGSLLRRFIKAAEPQTSARGNTNEIVNATIMVRDVRDRLIQHPARKMNLGFAVAEWIAFLVGIDDIEFFKLFVKSYGKFSTDGKTLDGAYGPRMFVEHLSEASGFGHQLTRVITMLKEDIGTRRAVVSIYGGSDLFGDGGLNTPCTLTLQFLYRDEKLNCIATMRSQDIVLGLTYDMFVWTMTLELISRLVGVEPGATFINCGSLHMYEADEHLIDEVDGRPFHGLMNQMPAIENDLVWKLAQLAESMPKMDAGDYIDAVERTLISPSADEQIYFRDLAWVLGVYAFRSDKREAHQMLMNIDDPVLRRVIRFKAPYKVAKADKLIEGEDVNE